MNWLRSWQPDVLIMEANPRYLRSGAVMNWMKARGGKVIGWGLGSPQPSGSLSKIRVALRKRFVRRFDGLITYSQQGADEYAALGFDPSDLLCTQRGSAQTCQPRLNAEWIANGKPNVVRGACRRQTCGYAPACVRVAG
jgi:hypothetical protein